MFMFQPFYILICIYLKWIEATIVKQMCKS